MLSWFADYDVIVCGRPFAWGQVTRTLADTCPTEDFDADGLVHALRLSAAERHGVDPGDIRIRQISRLL